MINEHDIRDFPYSPYADTVLLYELKNDSYFKFQDCSKVYHFVKPDGMYSICYDLQGNLFHFAVFSKVIEVKEPTNG